MTKKIKILHVEDSEKDFFLIMRELRKGGFEPTATRIDTEDGFMAQLTNGIWDIIFCDIKLPAFSATKALQRYCDIKPDIPFIVITGKVSAETVVELVRSGATDYVMKDNLARLNMVVERALDEYRYKNRYKALDKRGKLLYKLINQSQDAVFVVEPSSGKFLDVNETACSSLHYSREELLTMSIPDIELIIPEHKLKKHMETVREAGTMLMPGVHRCKNGQTFPVEVGITFLREDGEEYLLATARNVSERVKAEHEIRNLHKQQCFINDLLRLSLEDIDLKTVLLKIMESVSDFTGLKNELKGAILLPDENDPDTLVIKISHGFSQNELADVIKFTCSECSLKLHEKNDFKVIFNCTTIPGENKGHYCIPIKGTTGTLLGCIKLFTNKNNITINKTINEFFQSISNVVCTILEHKKNEESILTLSSAVEQSACSIVLTNLEGNIEYVNKKFCDITGYPPKEAIGQNPRILKSGNMSDQYYKELWDTITAGKVWRGEFHNKRKDGTMFWESATISGLKNKNNEMTHYLAIKEDISAKKELEEQLLQAQKLESIGQLAAGIAHEINTPIQFVSDNIRFLQDSYNDLLMLSNKCKEVISQIKKNSDAGEIIRQYEKLMVDLDLDYLHSEIPAAMEQSLEGVERVAKIVRAMKQFSHPGSDMMTRVNVNDAIDTTVTVASNEWKYHADMTLNLAPDLPSVPCFINEINQVVLNIIINAVHAIEAKDKHRKGSIMISTSFDEDYAIIKIKDSGTGIPDEIQNRIFDPFFTTKEIGKGTGQGLAMAWNIIVEKHNGKLNFDSTPEKGTEFNISIPLNQEAEMQPESSEEE